MGSGVRRFKQTTYDATRRIDETLAKHKSIIDAIAAGDANLAVERSTEHMRQAREARPLAASGARHAGDADAAEQTWPSGCWAGWLTSLYRCWRWPMGRRPWPGCSLPLARSGSSSVGLVYGSRPWRSSLAGGR